MCLAIGCDCSIEGKRSYGHYVGSYDVLVIDETDYGLSGHQKEVLDLAITSFYLVQEEQFPSSVLSTVYGHTEIHIRDDYIPCRYGSYDCHGCSSVGYFSNGGPFIYVSTIDNCSLYYLVQVQLNKLVPQVLGYDFREYDLLDNKCVVEINDCHLARRRLERTPVYNDRCTE